MLYIRATARLAADRDQGRLNLRSRAAVLGMPPVVARGEAHSPRRLQMIDDAPVRSSFK